MPEDKKLNVTRETLEELGNQVKELLEGVKANIDDYRFTVTSEMDGMTIEFYVKASLKKKNKK